MEACVARCSSPQNFTLFKTLNPYRKFINPLRSSSRCHFSNITTPISPPNLNVVRTMAQKKSTKAYDALLLDAGGTLLQLDKPVATTYVTIGAKYGLVATEDEVKKGFKRTFSAPWPRKLRYEGDGRPFWRLVVKEATGCDSNDYFEEVYEYFANGAAWRLPDGAREIISELKDAGVKVAVVSNFDTRLRKLLRDLCVLDLFDSVIISSEVGYEKPDGKIFKAALDAINVEAGRAVHVGDDQLADKEGANAIGIDCWLWGTEVQTFASIKDRIMSSGLKQ